VVAAIQGIERCRRQGPRAGWWWFLLAYLSVAVGIMLKGPIAVVLLGVVLGLAWASSPRKRPEEPVFRGHFIRGLLDACGLWWGVPLVLLLTLPWFLHANVQTDGAWFRVFFWHHNVDRGLGTDEKLRDYPIWFYGPQLLVDLLPWSLLLPVGAWYLWRNWRSDPEARFGAVWLVAMLLLLSCMRFKRADYLLPAYPGAALLLGCAMERWYAKQPARRLALAFAPVVLLMAAAWAGYLFWVSPLLEETRTHRLFAQEIRRQSPDKILFFRTEAHNVALHVGRPLATLLEWENLDIWAGKPQTTYVVLPRECLDEWPRQLSSGVLEVVAHSDALAPPLHKHLEQRVPWLAPWLRHLCDLGFDQGERPLVLVRTRNMPRPPGNSYTMRK
jgi:hypothetical protein